MAIIEGEYNSTQPTYTSGTHALQLDANGNLKTTSEHLGKKFKIISTTSPVYIGRNANDTILHGLVISAALTGTCVLNGFFDSAGNEQIYTLPAATTAGYKDFGGIINDAKALTVTCSNASDDNLVGVVYSTI
jgi:hypothetical protein